MTAHMEAKKEDIAKTVIMPGDPLRAKFIAENFLENPRLVNQVRGMLAYTGTYKGKKITVMGSGMGIPSIGIYSYELYKEYDVDQIIRIGTAGAYTKDLNLYDLLLVQKCYSESSFGYAQNGSENHFKEANFSLNFHIQDTASELGKHLTIAVIHSSDVFYKENDNFRELYEKYGCLACEMESFALFHNAEVLGKKAACILTVSNNLVTGQETTSEERQTALKEMITLALESSLKN